MEKWRCSLARKKNIFRPIAATLLYSLNAQRGWHSLELQIKSTLYLESFCCRSMCIIMLSSLLSQLLNTEMPKCIILPVLEYMYEILSLTLKGGGKGNIAWRYHHLITKSCAFHCIYRLTYYFPLLRVSVSIDVFFWEPQSKCKSFASTSNDAPYVRLMIAWRCSRKGCWGENLDLSWREYQDKG